jgi:hypothetical protein
MRSTRFPTPVATDLKGGTLALQSLVRTVRMTSLSLPAVGNWQRHGCFSQDTLNLLHLHAYPTASALYLNLNCFLNQFLSPSQLNQ